MTNLINLLSSLTQEATSPRSKVAIVTGTSSGIGLKLTKKLAANGYRVVANSRHLTSANTLLETDALKLVDSDIGLLSIAIPRSTPDEALAVNAE